MRILEMQWVNPAWLSANVFTLYKGKGGSAPPPPDYVGAANATAAGNKEAAVAQTEANRVNQYTPYGNMIYNQYGTSAAGNPLWQVTQTLSPTEQSKLDKNNALELGLLGTAQSGLGYVDKTLSNPMLDESKLTASMVKPGETYIDAAMRFMQPGQDRDRSMLETKLANQGIMQGSEAYSNALRDLVDQQDRARLQAVMGGMDENQRQRQQSIQEQTYQQDRPLNVINALRTGSQVNSPQFSNVPQQQYAPGPDILGATQAQYQGQLNAYNAKQASAGNMMGGLFGLGTGILTAGSAPWWMA